MVKPITQVLKTNQDLVEAKRECVVGQSSPWLISFEKLDLRFELVFWFGCQVLWHGVVEGEGIFQRLVNEDLLTSLLRVCRDEIENLHIVAGSALDTIAFRIDLIQHLNDTLAVISWKSSILHDLNLSLFAEVSRTTLSSVVQDGDLEVATILVSHGNSWGNRVVVRGDISILFSHIVGIVRVKVSLLHGQSIWISPELALWIKSIIELPVDSDIFSIAGLFVKWDTVKLDLILNDFLKEFWGESHSNDGLFLGSGIGVDEGVLVEECSLLEDDVCIQLRVWIVVLSHIWSFPFWPYSICSLWSQSSHFLQSSKVLIINISSSLWILEPRFLMRLVVP